MKLFAEEVMPHFHDKGPIVPEALKDCVKS
jgi:hypothetical protein